MKYFKLSTAAALADPARNASSPEPAAFGVDNCARIAAKAAGSLVVESDTPVVVLGVLVGWAVWSELPVPDCEVALMFDEGVAVVLFEVSLRSASEASAPASEVAGD